jgi:hypothetical protein
MGAIVEGHPEVVDLLLQYGARLDDVNEMGTTALTLALAYDPHVARKLIDAGASLRLPETDGGIPLVAAARLGLTDFVILIQERMGTRVRPSDLRLAHLEARNSGHSEITALLERQGVAPWPDGVSLFDRRLPFVPRDIEDCVAGRRRHRVCRYLPSSSDLCLARCTACSKMLVQLFCSRNSIAAWVVPPGDVTRARSSAGPAGSCDRSSEAPTKVW